jgi:signal transduction histidine kinase
MLKPLVRTRRPPLTVGILAGLSCVLGATGLIHLIKHLAPVSSLGMIYLLGVMLIATVWGLVPAVVTALVSALAFHYLFLWPVHDGTEWVVLPTFLIVGVLAASIAQLARSSAKEATERRAEADLAAEQARYLLRAEDLSSALPGTSRRLAYALNLPSAEIVSEVVTADRHHTAFPLRDGERPIGTLIVPCGLSPSTLHILGKRIVPSLEALLGAAREREAIANALESSRDELRRIAEQQAALRRVATLVARAVSPQELFDAVAGEMGRIVKAEYIAVSRFEADGELTVVGCWSGAGELDCELCLGSRWPLDKGTIAGLLSRTGRPGRVVIPGNNTEGTSGWARSRGVTWAVGCPIEVLGRQWGAVIALSGSAESPPADVEARMLDFTELVATAIANAQSLAELAASRARVVAATDETRRRIERDLHDGTQQQLVSLGLELRRVALALPSGSVDLQARLDHAARGLADAVENLREISRGLHPAILSMGGLEPALKTIARRSHVPVELSMRGVRRLPERIEVAAYFIVSEALTNVAKHARASVVNVDLDVDDHEARLTIRDDGIGGSDPAHGSGLIGLKDRVEALCGEIQIISPAGAGTTLLTSIPIPTQP